MSKQQKNAALDFMTRPQMSKYKEQFSEYLFLKDLMLAAAKQNTELAVSRTDFDSFGFDLMLSVRDQERNWRSVRVQLKSTFKHTRWDVHKSLIEDPDGRIVVIRLRSENQEITPEYLLFDRNSASIALARIPKVPHPAKCQVRLGKNEFIDINDDLLLIFK